MAEASSASKEHTHTQNQAPTWICCCAPAFLVPALVARHTVVSCWCEVEGLAEATDFWLTRSDCCLGSRGVPCVYASHGRVHLVAAAEAGVGVCKGGSFQGSVLSGHELVHLTLTVLLLFLSLIDQSTNT